MRHRTIAASAALILAAACAPTTADDPLTVDARGASAAAESPPELIAVADAMQARVGQRIGEDMTLTGAAAQGDTLVMTFRHDLSAADLSPAGREEIAVGFANDFRAQMCGAPATRAFVEQRGGVRAPILGADGVELTTLSIDSCA